MRKKHFRKSKERAENSARAALYFDDGMLGGLMTFDKFQGRRDSSQRQEQGCWGQARNRQGAGQRAAKGDRHWQKQSSIQMGDSQKGQTRRLEQDGGSFRQQAALRNRSVRESFVRECKFSMALDV